jgi:hypothetical protein
MANGTQDHERNTHDEHDDSERPQNCNLGDKANQ